MLAKFNIDKFNSNLLLTFFLLYYTQSVFFGGGVVGPILSILIVSISVYYLLKIVNKGIPLNSFAKLWLIFILNRVFVYFISGNFELNFAVFKTLLLNTLPFYAFYYCIVKNILSTRQFVVFILVSIPLFILNFYKSYFVLENSENSENIVVTAASYMFIGLLPFVFMIRNKLLASFLLLIIWYFLIESSKKAAVLCGVFAIVIFAYQNLYLLRREFSFLRAILSFLIITLVAYYSYNLYVENEFLQARFQRFADGGDSVREEIVEKTFVAWYNSDNVITYFFGLGFDSAKKVTGYSSHNDIVDAITSFGLFGFLLFLSIFYQLMRFVLRNGWNSDKKIIMYVFLMIAFVTALSNRWLTNAFPFMISMFLPYLLLTNKEPIK